MNNRIYQLCQDVIARNGVNDIDTNCDNIKCSCCPFSSFNNIDRLSCEKRMSINNKKIAESWIKRNYKSIDHVNSPSHYTQGNIEVIEVIEDWKLNYNLGNAIKYIGRCEHKGNKKQDLEKAIWYIKREIERCK